MSVTLQTHIIKSKMSLIAPLIILTVLSGLTIPELLEYYSAEETGNWKAVAAYLETKSQSFEIIIVEPYFTKKVFLYYYTRNNLVISWTEVTLTALEDMCRYNRVWFVYHYHRRERFDEDRKIWNWLTHRDVPGERKSFEGIRLFFLLPEEPAWLKACIFYHSSLESKMVLWAENLNVMGASVSAFDETAVISSVDISEFDVVVFVGFTRPLNDLERVHIKDAIQNGLSVVVSDVSPRFLAGEGTDNLTKISSWFGATHFSTAPKEARWKVKFTENAKNVMPDLALDREYEFYKDFNSSTPHGCLVQPESVVYAYRVDDNAAVIFSHKFGNGTSIFVGPRYGFVSPDKEIFKAFLHALIRSLKTP